MVFYSCLDCKRCSNERQDSAIAGEHMFARYIGWAVILSGLKTLLETGQPLVISA